MRKYRTLASGAGAAIVSLAAVSSAQAAYLVEVWGGYNDPAGTTNPDPGVGPGNAQDPAPGIAPVASFTYNGPINWVDNEPNNGDDDTMNLFGQFLNGADISGFSGLAGYYTSDAAGLTNFLNSSMSVLDDDPTGSYYTYMQITGSTSGGTATISHDDGASVYTGAPGSGTNIYSSPGETSDDTASFTMPSGQFYIDYEESNGAPSDLVFNVVPEPATWTMMILGVAGIGGVMRLRRSRNMAPAV